MSNTTRTPIRTDRNTNQSIKQVLEESPSVLLRPETRRAMQQQAAMLARAVKYRCVSACV